MHSVAVIEWDANDVGQLLMRIRLERYVEEFRVQNISGRSLLYVSDSDLVKTFKFTLGDKIIFQKNQDALRRIYEKDTINKNYIRKRLAALEKIASPQGSGLKSGGCGSTLLIKQINQKYHARNFMPAINEEPQNLKEEDENSKTYRSLQQHRFQKSKSMQIEALRKDGDGSPKVYQSQKSPLRNVTDYGQHSMNNDSQRGK